jgi:hypothetical protein
MTLFYNEAEVRISDNYALINFGAYTNKGSHVRHKMKGFVKRIYAQEGPMDYITSDTPCVVQIGTNVSLALSRRLRNYKEA